MFQKNAKVSHPRAAWQACFDGKTSLAGGANRCFAFGQ
jgi:hypothetical protein